LLFLDEPTTGFDPSARRAAWDVISGLRDLGKTILLTTHYMEEAHHLADRIAVISKGEIVASGTAASLGERARKASTIRFTLPPGMVVADLPTAAASAVTAGTDGEVELNAAARCHLSAPWRPGPVHGGSISPTWRSPARPSRTSTSN